MILLRGNDIFYSFEVELSQNPVPFCQNPPPFDKKAPGFG